MSNALDQSPHNPKPLSRRPICVLQLIDYGVRTPITGELMLSGAHLTDIDGFALSYPTSADLMNVVAIVREPKTLAERCVEVSEDDAETAVLARALWKAAQQPRVTHELEDKFARQLTATRELVGGRAYA